MGNEFLDLQRLALGRVAQEGDGFLRAVGDARPAAHAGMVVDPGPTIVHRDGTELARVGARTAGGAQLGVHLGDIARGSQHGRAVVPCLHRPAATGAAAVADGVKSPEHSIFVNVDTIEHVPSL